MHRIFYLLKQAGDELRYLQFKTKLSSLYFFYEYLKMSFKNTQPSDSNCVKNSKFKDTIKTRNLRTLKA